MTSAIVILNYNSSSVTIRYLKELTAQKEYDHIVVVDNASKQEDAAVLSRYCEENSLIFLAEKENKGYSAGNNTGARYAVNELKADIIFISNPDIICPQETIRKIKSVFLEKKEAAVVTGLVHVFDKERKPSPYRYFAYKAPTYSDMVLNNLYLCTKLRMKTSKYSMYFDVNEVIKKKIIQAECVSGCFFAMKSSVYQEMNGFDEDTFLYYEEAILGYRIKQAGYSVYVIDAPVYHDEDPGKRSTVGKLWRTHKITQNSARVYLSKYLKVKGWKMALYNFSSYVHFGEQVVLNRIAMLK